MDTPHVRTCTKCHISKSLDDFPNAKGGKYGKDSRCKACRREYRLAYDEANWERIQARNAAYHQEHLPEHKIRDAAYRERTKDQIQTRNKKRYDKQKDEGTRWQDRFPEQKKATDRASYHKHIDKRHDYNRKNRDKRNAQAKDWAERNRDYLVESRRKNRERDAARIRAWAKDHPEARAMINERRRASKMEAPRNDLSHPQWVEIQELQGHRCYYCKKRCKGKLTQDHILPLSQGGSHTLQNVIAVCRSCNSRKGKNAPPIPVQPLLLSVAPAKPFKKKGA